MHIHIRRYYAINGTILKVMAILTGKSHDILCEINFEIMREGRGIKNSYDFS